MMNWMSGKDETTFAMQRRVIEEEEERYRRERHRTRRINNIKRWTGKVGVVIISLVVIVLVFNFFASPITVDNNTTVVSGTGDFDKAIVSWELTGDSTTKQILIILEEPNKEFIASTGSQTFYNRGIAFYITTYINGFAQPIEEFILLTEGSSSIMCKNNISIVFTFGVSNTITVPIIEAEGGAVVSLVTLTAVGIGLIVFFIVAIGWIDDRWRGY